jgi:hypothetical protein
MASGLAKLAGFQLVHLALIAVLIPSPAKTEPCNPIIDGTYCATQMPKGRAGGVSSSKDMNPIRSLGSDFGANTPQDQPGTLGSISFRGGGNRCFGTIVRSRCS